MDLTLGKIVVISAIRPNLYFCVEWSPYSTADTLYVDSAVVSIYIVVICIYRVLSVLRCNNTSDIIGGSRVFTLSSFIFFHEMRAMLRCK